MACDNGVVFTFEPVHTGATYKLSIEGSPGTFTSTAAHHHGSGVVDPVDMNGEPITSTTGLDLVFVTVNIISPAPVTVKVQASVTGVASTYCREITGGSGVREILTHRIRLA